MLLLSRLMKNEVQPPTVWLLVSFILEKKKTLAIQT